MVLNRGIDLVDMSGFHKRVGRDAGCLARLSFRHRTLWRSYILQVCVSGSLKSTFPDDLAQRS